MKLTDTIDYMSSKDWTKRFLAEYFQVKYRQERLRQLRFARELGKLDFKTPVSEDSWREQSHYMAGYREVLEHQAAAHGIDLQAEEEKLMSKVLPRQETSAEVRVIAWLNTLEERIRSEIDAAFTAKATGYEVYAAALSAVAKAFVEIRNAATEKE